MKHMSLRRLGAIVVSTALAVGVTITGTSPAQAGAPQDQATRWLATQLSNGVVHNDEFDFDDYGLTADVGFALHSAGDHERTVRDIRKALAKNVRSWTTGADFGSDDVYAGSTAKALVFAQISAGNPRDFGGTNLVKQLNRLVLMDGPVGRIKDRSSSGDFANTIGQAYAARGLAVSKSSKADEVLGFLLQQQCSQGYFRLNFAQEGASKQSCDAGSPKSVSAPDTDATAIAVLSLLALPKRDRTVILAIDDAIRWLIKRQERNGSFGGGPSTEAPNANSTGLAGWALGRAGACAQAHDAAQWVRGLFLNGVKGGRGAIAYDKKAKKAAEAAGVIDDSQRDQFRRATSQAAPALAFVVEDTCR